MPGYTGDPDAEATHALIINENGIHAIQQQLLGPILTECRQCGEDIPQARVQAMRINKMKCVMCITCQQVDDMRPKARIKMLDRIL